MPDRFARARQIGRDMQESEAYVAAVNESAARAERREKIARDKARERYEQPDTFARDPDIEILETVEYRDAGYWVAARVWVDADDVEAEMEEVPDGPDAV